MAAAGVDYIEGEERYGRRWYDDNTIPLQLAALEVAKLAIHLGGDVNAANDDGLTAMHGAAYMGSNLLVQFLFDHRAKLDVRNRRGCTPYFITQGIYVAGTFIARKDTGELMRRLGADVNLGVELWKDDVDPRQSEKETEAVTRRDRLQDASEACASVRRSGCGLTARPASASSSNR